jgi:hypothetical protein
MKIDPVLDGLPLRALTLLNAIRGAYAWEQHKDRVQHREFLHALRERGLVDHDAFGVWRLTKRGREYV